MTIPYGANWPETSRKAKDFYRWKCAVCGYDYKKNGSYLTTHHYDYRNFGHEKMSDLACLCWAHHPKGAFSKKDIAMWRTSYLLTKALGWVCVLPFRVLATLLRWAFRNLHVDPKQLT